MTDQLAPQTKSHFAHEAISTKPHRSRNVFCAGSRCRAPYPSWWIFVSLLTVLPLFGGEQDPETVPFRVYIDFQHAPPAPIQNDILGEVDDIMGPLGWHLEWNNVRDALGLVAVKQAMVRFKGACTTSDLTVYGGFAIALTLGRTYTSAANHIMPFADIFCDAIRAYIVPELLSREGGQRDGAFARAIARVVAHELYHIFGDTSHHGSKGLAKAILKPEELVANHLNFEQGEIARLRGQTSAALVNFDVVALTGRQSGHSVFMRSGCGGCHGFYGEGTQWGPPFPKGRKLYDSALLQRRLNGNQTEMYARAEKLRIPWPKLSAAEIEDLSAFLSSISEDGNKALRSPKQHGTYDSGASN